jgi:hypothetical protein
VKALEDACLKASLQATHQRASGTTSDPGVGVGVDRGVTAGRTTAWCGTRGGPPRASSPELIDIFLLLWDISAFSRNSFLLQ